MMMTTTTMVIIKNMMVIITFNLYFYLTEKSVQLKVCVEDYQDKLMDHCVCRISCMGIVKETRQTFAELEELRLRKPHLTLKVCFTQIHCVENRPTKCRPSFLQKRRENLRKK